MWIKRLSAIGYRLTGLEHREGALKKGGRLWRLMPFMLLILIGVWLRLPGIWANTFHTDEALFATWARYIGVWKDPLLQTQFVDKPPLLFYLQALFYPLMGTPAGWPARMPNWIAFILLMPITARLSWQLFHNQLLSWVATALVALSPLAIQFTPTAFTDPLLTTLLMAAAVALLTGRSGWSGILFGLALTTKYQAILLLPLILLLGSARGWPNDLWRRWVLGFVPWPVLILIWDLARTGRFSLWANQVASYGGVGIGLGDNFWTTLEHWRYLSSFILGPLLLLWLLLFALLLPFGLRQRESVALSLAVLFYATLHLMLGVSAWDRYLLPIVPLLLILLARVGVEGMTRLRLHLGKPGQWLGLGLLIMLLGVMVPGAMTARLGGHAIGGQPTADSGAALAAASLQKMPWGTVLYDRYYSWHWRFHFLDRPVFVNWQPHSIGLAGDLAVHGYDDTLRFLAWPAERTTVVLERDLAAVGFELRWIERFEQINIYQLMPVES